MWINRRILAPGRRDRISRDHLHSTASARAAASPAADESVNITAKSYFSLFQELARERMTTENVDLNKHP